jgi:hypothetical protein
MNCLATTEPFSLTHHGKTNNSSPNIEAYYLIGEVFTCDEFMNDEYEEPLDIVEIVELPGLEQIAIVKTIWLKLLQRKCKKRYQTRKQIIEPSSTPQPPQ